MPNHRVLAVPIFAFLTAPSPRRAKPCPPQTAAFSSFDPKLAQFDYPLSLQRPSLCFNKVKI
jgi:hypothetical protein